MVSDLLPPDIRVDAAIGGVASGTAIINEDELIQVMTNLARNAAEAMDGRGTMAIGLRGLDPIDAAPRAAWRYSRPLLRGLGFR